MTRWTDYEATLHIPDAHLTQASNIIASYTQGSYQVNASGDRISVVDDTHLTVRLTQRETGGFSAKIEYGKHAILNVNFLDGEGKRRKAGGKEGTKVPIEDNNYEYPIPAEDGDST